MQKNLAIDIGGTSIRFGIGDTNQHQISKQDLPDSYAELIQQIAEHATEQQVTEIIIGIPGIITDGKVIKTPNINWLDKQELVDDLNRELNTTIYLQNDSALYGLAEASQLAEGDSQVIAYIGIGTGVGGVRIDHGQIDNNSFGFEPGHQIIDYGNNLELEKIIGGGAIIQETGKRPTEIVDKSFWDKKYPALAAGVYNTILHWSPDKIIFGGGMILNDVYKLDRIEAEILKINQLLPKIPELIKSSLGDNAGVIGGFTYLESL